MPTQIRGHGVFKLYKSQAAVAKRVSLNDTEIKRLYLFLLHRPAGSRGSSDLAH